MSTTVTIGYGDGSPLEPAAQVDLLVNGEVAATANPDDSGQVVFPVDPPSDASLAVRFHPSAS
jgi:hypothetical protein